MNEKALPILAITVSVVAIVVSLARRDGGEGLPSSAEQNTQLDRLDRRLRLLESKIDTRNTDPDRKLSALANTDIVNPDGENPSLDEIRDRQEKLESELADLGVLDHFVEQKQKIEKAYASALDPDQGTKDRLEALGMLRKAERIDERVVASMVTMWDDSIGTEGGGWTRWFLMENMEGIHSPEFRDSILEWLPDEESPKLRGHAIETLASMGPDPNVDQWLDYLGENDPEPKIRDLATRIRRDASQTK